MSLYAIVVLKLPCSLKIYHSRSHRKCYVRTSVNFKVNVLDDFATQCVGNSSVVTFGAVLLQLVRQFILLAPTVVVAVAFIAADCQPCNASQNRRCGSFFTNVVHFAYYSGHGKNVPRWPIQNIVLIQKYNSVPHKFVQDIFVLSVNLCNKILIHVWPVPVAARSKAWVCGRPSAEIVSSNPTGGMDVCRECCVLSGRGPCDELITDHSSGGVLPTVVRRCVWSRNLVNEEALAHWRLQR